MTSTDRDRLAMPVFVVDHGCLSLETANRTQREDRWRRRPVKRFCCFTIQSHVQDRCWTGTTKVFR